MIENDVTAPWFEPKPVLIEFEMIPPDAVVVRLLTPPVAKPPFAPAL